MKEKRLEDLLDVVGSTQDLREHDAPLDNLTSYIKNLNLIPGDYKLNVSILLSDFKVDKNNIDVLIALGFKITAVKTKKYISVSKKDKERLTLEYAQKISEKIYKEEVEKK